ncbi:MAG: hypothetical protein A3F68_10945 [Acidobacteria bacterium RIFCSPLOWO2_12_FULL_54_10]|nr:MAG: hypothetical protein A3F68_10945 [Acidobacteria bacterium RIFCSPLOWO2_12_FULL_54_10]
MISETSADADSHFRLALALLIAVFSLAIPGKTQGPRNALAVQTADAIRIDGLLDEAAWRQAQAVTEFFQKDPHEGEISSERTEVRILYTNSSIYFGIRCYDTEPSHILATELRRDNDFANDDSISVILDTFHDRRSAFQFRTNPQGTQYDALVTDEGRITDVNWDEQWASVAKTDDGGWTAEIEIPFKSLRLSPKEEQSWGIDFERVIRRKNEFTYWSNYHRGFNFTQVSQAGNLNGLKGLTAGLTLRVKPFVKSAITHIDGDPLVVSDVGSLSDIGLEDVKWRITSDFTADFTVNTDFAETDVDAQVLNLTRFPVFFPEKREFFVEGAGIFDYGPGGGAASEMKLFFSRRIGLSPDPQRATIPILAGGKLTGKTNGWTVGLLDVQTDQFDKIPKRNFSVLRVKKDLFARSNAGIIATNRDSAVSGDPYNRGVGVDANFFFLDHFSIQGFATSTFSPGKDKDHWAGRIRSFWDSDFVFVNGEHMVLQRNFNPEMGWLPRGDMKKTRAQFDLKPRPNNELIRQFFLRSTLDYITNQAGELETRNQDFSFETAFQSGDRVIARYTHMFDRIRRNFSIQNRLPVAPGDHTWEFAQFRFIPSSNRILSGEVNIRREWGFYGGQNTEFNWSPLWKPTPRLSINPTYQWNRVKLASGKFTSNLINSQVNYAFSNAWLTGTTLQYNSLAKLVVVNFRLNYIYRPGDDFFLIYNESRNLADSPTGRLVNRSIIAKITHSWDF